MIRQIVAGMLPDVVEWRFNRALGPEWRDRLLGEQVDVAIAEEIRASPLYASFARSFERRLQRGDAVGPALDAVLGPENVMALQVIGPLLVEDVLHVATINEREARP